MVSTHMAKTLNARRREMAHLRQLEQDVREFLAEFEQYPESYFAPPTVRLAQRIRPVIEQLDHVRCRQQKTEG